MRFGNWLLREFSVDTYLNKLLILLSIYWQCRWFCQRRSMELDSQYLLLCGNKKATSIVPCFVTVLLPESYFWIRHRKCCAYPNRLRKASTPSNGKNKATSTFLWCFLMLLWKTRNLIAISRLYAMRFIITGITSWNFEVNSHSDHEKYALSLLS